MAKVKKNINLLFFSLATLVLGFCITHVDSQFRFYTLFAYRNYNNSENLLLSATLNTFMGCLLKCNTLNGCVIIAATLNADGTKLCRFYHGFFGISNPLSWQFYQYKSYVFFRGFLFFIMIFIITSFKNLYKLDYFFILSSATRNKKRNIYFFI